MMKIDIVCVGKIKEAFYRDAICEYAKRLSAYCDFRIIEVADEPAPEGAPAAEVERIKDREGERILSKLPAGAFVVTLEIDGKSFSSEGFAEKLGSLMTGGMSHVQFVIGGSLGLSPKVSCRAGFKLSFSAMTFPHQLMRVILSEQIYRAFRIMRGEPYHK